MILNIIGKITVSTKISVCMLFFLYALFLNVLLILMASYYYLMSQSTIG